MPKGFSDDERQVIKAQLIEKGTELFGLYGIKKTNIQDLTEAVGIAKGSFYLFYNSKEELFLDVLEETEHQLLALMEEIIQEMKNNPKEAFRKFLAFHFQSLDENPIIKLFRDKETIEHLNRKLSGTPRYAQKMDAYDYISSYIKAWQKKGVFIKEDPKILAGTLKALFTIGLQDEMREYIGRETYPKVIEFLITLLTDHLVISSR